MTDRINEVAEKIKVAIYFGEHSNVLLLLTALVTETEERVREECARKELEDAGTTMGRVYDIRRDVEGYIGAENEHTDRLAGWVIELCDIATDSALRQQEKEK